jgi:hypothetical protein
MHLSPPVRPSRTSISSTTPETGDGCRSSPAATRPSCSFSAVGGAEGAGVLPPPRGSPERAGGRVLPRAVDHRRRAGRDQPRDPTGLAGADAMSWCWLAHLEAPADDASAQAAAYEVDGSPAGWLAAWRGRAKPLRSARRWTLESSTPREPPHGCRSCDRPRASGCPSTIPRSSTPAARCSPAGRRTACPRCSATRRISRARSRWRAAPGWPSWPTTRSRGSSPARILRVEAGLLSVVTAPVGPTIERYGSAQPWPWDRYDAARFA